MNPEPERVVSVEDEGCFGTDMGRPSDLRHDPAVLDPHRSLEDVETQDAAVRGARLFSLDDLDEIVVHPPIKRFLQRWQPGDPAVYLGSLWAR